MKDSVRRILIFVTIIGAGTLLIFNDMPLLLILPVIIAIGFILLILLGAISLSDIKGMFRKKTAGKSVPAEPAQKPDVKASAKPAAPPKKRFSLGLPSFLKRKRSGNGGAPAGSASQRAAPATDSAERRFLFDVRSWFRKKSSGSPAAAPVVVQKPSSSLIEKKKGVSFHISSLVSSFKSFGTILKTKKKADPDKLKKIDSMLDLAVHGKAENPVIPQAGALAGTPASPGVAAAVGGGIGAVESETANEDPFLSLSNDELDAGLLDGLDDDDTGAASATLPEGESPIITITIPDDDSASTPGGDVPLPPELVSAADDILKANEAESAGMPGLEGLESVDDNLGDLDSLSLDSMDLGDDDDDENTGLDLTSAPAVAATAAAPVPAPSPAASPTPSGKKGSDQSEMAAFAAASGGDDDMLSSLAADIKTVKKEQDLSLLRELKDFHAPGTTIETDLTDLYTVLNTAAERQKKIRDQSGTKKPQAK